MKINCDIIWIGAQTILKTVMAIAVLRVAAHFFNPSQFYIYSQFQYLLVGITGLIATVPSHKFSVLTARTGSSIEQEKIRNTAFGLILIFTLFFLAAALYAGKSVAEHIGVAAVGRYYLLVPISGAFGGLTAMLLAQRTGCGDGVGYSKLVILTAFLSFICMISAITLAGLAGAMVGFLVAPVISFIVANRFFNKNKISIKMDRRIALQLIRFSIVSVVIYLVQYTVNLKIRADYALHRGENEAGFLLAAIRISELYMGAVAALYANRLLYYFSSGGSHASFVIIVKKLRGYGLAITLGVLALAILSNYIVMTIYGEKFLPASMHLRYISISDGVKCLYWVFAYLIISRGNDLWYMAIELLSLLVFYFAMDPIVGLIANKFAYELALLIQNSTALVAATLYIRFLSKNK